MDRPLIYRDSYVVSQNLPYEMIEIRASGSHVSGGVLGKGRRVWMQQDSQGSIHRHAAFAYVEDIGIISLNPHLLSRLH